VWTPDQSAAHPPLPPLPPVPGGAPPAAPASAVAADDLLFCEGCGGSFTINNLTTTPDGAVLCKDCAGGAKKPAARGTVFTPPPPGFVPKPAKEKWKGPSTGGMFAGGGGLLVVMLIIGKIALRGCVSYERAQRRERDRSNDNVPAQVEEDTEAVEE
jgi:hypothetical protein